MLMERSAVVSVALDLSVTTGVLGVPQATRNHVSSFFEKLSIAWEYARARKSRRHRLASSKHTSVGDLLLPADKGQSNGSIYAGPVDD
jgi:hypothetical protein